MKERLSIKEFIFVLTSSISPFGAVMIKPLKGLNIDVEDLSDERAPLSEGPKIDENGRVILPSGSSARIHIKKGDYVTHFNVEDYRGRPGHTPGARITGDGVDINLDSKENKKFVPEIGYTRYRE